MEKVDGKVYLNNEALKTLEKEDSKFSPLCSDIATAIQSKSLTIIELIHQLGCLLTDQSYSKRETGVLILAQVLHNLDSGFLNTEQLNVLSSYFVEKVKDHHQVVPAALKGLLACINCKDLQPTSVVQILTSIFQHISCQQQQQADKYNIYQIFEIAVKKYPTEVRSLNYDFVYGVISSIDGERDPKNLRYLFSWMPLCLRTVKLGHLSEEMFEVLACYFPVDFKAPSSDPNTTTREDLANGLCNCLTAIPEFGENALPLALEKLDSDLKIAKEDSLEILKKGCQVYEVSAYSTHSIEIWYQLQKEIFNTNDENLRRECLDTFTAVVGKLAQDNEENVISFVTDIVDTLKGNLIPNQKLFLPSSWILIAVSGASIKSSTIVANKIIPLLENTYRITINSKHRALILSICVEVTANLIEYNTYSSQNFNVPFICLQAIAEEDTDLRCKGYNGLSNIAKVLLEEERNILFEHLNKSIILDDDSTVRPFILKCLNSMAVCYPEEIKLKIIEKQKAENVDQLDNYLEALCILSNQSFFKSYVVEQLISHAVTNIEHTPVAVKNISKIIGISEDLDKLFLEKYFINKLIGVVLDSNQSFELTFLENLSLTLNKLIRSQSSEKQQEIFSNQWKMRIQDNAVSIAVFKGLIISMNSDAFKQFEDDLVGSLLELTLRSQNNFVKDTSVKLLANLINKMEKGFLLDEKLYQITKAYNSNIQIRHDILAWVAKALVVRNHPDSLVWVDQILDRLEADKEMCEGLKIILNDSYEELSRINHCQVMPLYRQKFFVYCTNKITEKYEPQKSNYLIAVGCLIELAPAQAVAAQFKKILKLIIHCLEKCNEPTVLVNLLHRIQEFVEKREKSIEDNLEDILLRVLNLTVFEFCMKVRIAALHCLSKFAQNYEVYKLLPMKDKVTRHLGTCVDDKKRLVRKEAMHARAVWYLLDAPI